MMLLFSGTRISDHCIDSRPLDTCNLYHLPSMASLISATAWVARGVAQSQPTKYKLDEAELERFSKLARIDIEDARRELEKASKEIEKWAPEKEVEGDADGDDAAWEE